MASETSLMNSKPSPKTNAIIRKITNILTNVPKQPRLNIHEKSATRILITNITTSTIATIMATLMKTNAKAVPIGLILLECYLHFVQSLSIQDSPSNSLEQI